MYSSKYSSSICRCTPNCPRSTIQKEKHVFFFYLSSKKKKSKKKKLNTPVFARRGGESFERALCFFFFFLFTTCSVVATVITGAQKQHFWFISDFFSLAFSFNFFLLVPSSLLPSLPQRSNMFG